MSSIKKMTKKILLDLCSKNKLYRTPHLNDVLYLHFQGFGEIENLEEYTQVKCLWLESNAISQIKGLNSMKHLRCLFLQNNLINKIEQLQYCTELDTLNLSHNYINKIENCGKDVLPMLNTLDVSHNNLRTADRLNGLKECLYLSVLDISHNKIEDVVIVKILSEMPALRVLCMTGNPVVSQIPSYRKTLILECKQLTYLDSRPVFPKDRACAEAWKRGGFSEEQKEQRHWIKKERKRTRDSVNALLALRKNHNNNVELLKSSDDEDEIPFQSTNIDYGDNDNNEHYNLLAWKSIENQVLHLSESVVEPTANCLAEARPKPFNPMNDESQMQDNDANIDIEVDAKKQNIENNLMRFPLKCEISSNDNCFPIRSSSQEDVESTVEQSSFLNTTIHYPDPFTTVTLTPSSETYHHQQVNKNTSFSTKEKQFEYSNKLQKTVQMCIEDWKTNVRETDANCTSEIAEQSHSLNAIEKLEPNLNDLLSILPSDCINGEENVDTITSKLCKINLIQKDNTQVTWQHSKKKTTVNKILSTEIMQTENQSGEKCNLEDSDFIHTNGSLSNNQAKILASSQPYVNDIEAGVIEVSNLSETLCEDIPEQIETVDSQFEDLKPVDIARLRLSKFKRGPLLFLIPETDDAETIERSQQRLFLINKLLQATPVPTLDDTRLIVGGNVAYEDLNKLRTERFKERSEKLQQLVDRIYARRDEINARFDKIQQLWGNFKNPHKLLEKLDHENLIRDTKQLTIDAATNSESNIHVVEQQISSNLNLTYTKIESDDNWKEIYLQEPVNLSENIDMKNCDCEILKAIVSLIIESCVEFNMMTAFQFFNFNQNLACVIEKCRKRLQTFLNFFQEKKYVDDVLQEWKCHRGLIYEFQDIFSLNDGAKDKIKQLIMKEYSIDYDNDSKKLEHLDRIILTCKQVYKSYKDAIDRGPSFVCETKNSEETSSDESD